MGVFAAALPRCKRTISSSRVRPELYCEDYYYTGKHWVRGQGISQLTDDGIITFDAGDIMLLPVSCALSCKGFAPRLPFCLLQSHSHTDC